MFCTGCAATTAPSPTKIEGRLGSVSKSDIEQAIRLVEDDMRHDFWIVYAIDHVAIHSRDEIVVFYSRGNYTSSIIVQRIHGVWTIYRGVRVTLTVPGSNQALQATAGRSDVSLKITKTHLLQLALALADGARA